MNLLRMMWQDDEGQDLVEYALLAALVGVVAIVSITAAGGSIQGIWTSISGALAAVPS